MSTESFLAMHRHRPPFLPLYSPRVLGENSSVKLLRHSWLSGILLCASAGRLWAGGSGLNVAVVVNAASTNSLELGNYYCERRQVPPQNVLRINWPISGAAVTWSGPDFTNYLLNPLGAMLASRQLTNQIDFLLLSMDIPYRIQINNGNDRDSTTSALFYGFKTNTTPPAGEPPGCSLPPASSNYYAGSEFNFRGTSPGSLTWSNLLTTMITDNSDVPLAKMMVDQGVNSDATFPTQSVVLAKSGDPQRNVRYRSFDNAIFNTRLRGNYSMQRTNSDYNWIYGNILGYQNGVYYSSVTPTTYVPGAMADNLTSYGGNILDPTDQLNMLQFIAAGAAGTYGTIDEPCNYLEKFPSPQNFFYQARGFALAECYYLSVTNPYQGLLLGEPLASPFASPGRGVWNNLPANAPLSGTTNLSVQFTASDWAHPLRQVDLFVDGLFLQTLTNIPPGTNNILYVTINGAQTNYTVPAAATLSSIVSNLTVRLNATIYTNATKPRATAHGDRIELQFTDRSKLGAEVPLSVSNYIGSGTVLTTGIRDSGTNFLDTVAYGLRNFLVNSGAIYPPPIGAWLQLSVVKTNGVTVNVGVTNSTLGATVPVLVSNLVNAINAASVLLAVDGCAAEDFIDYFRQITLNSSDHRAEFNVRARSPGWNAAQLQATLTGSATSFSIPPTGAQKLEQNLNDLQPRAHLYVTAGVTNLPLTFAFNTTTQAHGPHELTAVAYEGSHVRVQARASQTVRIQNDPLAATFTTLAGASNAMVSLTLQFSVTANTNNISKIELFSTGGSLGSVLGQSNALFSVAGTYLGLGLHPFYALVTASNGKQYRTETKWIRLVSVPPFVEPSFSIAITSPPPTLLWPATAGRSYDILSTTSITNSFQLRAALVPSNSPAVWAETNTSARQRFYRVRTSN